MSARAFSGKVDAGFPQKMRPNKKARARSRFNLIGTRPRGRSSRTERKTHASVFAALGDETRLSLVAKLCGGRPQSISQLTEGSKLTRQAITKHLQVLEGAGVVRGVRVGRESQFEFKPEPIDDIKKCLDLVSEQWDQTLARLQSFVEG